MSVNILATTDVCGGEVLWSDLLPLVENLFKVLDVGLKAMTDDNRITKFLTMSDISSQYNMKHILTISEKYF
jgi:hypothetical protein